MIPTHASKKGRRYRYYVSHSLIERGRPKASDTARRVPASELERLVEQRIMSPFLHDRRRRCMMPCTTWPGAPSTPPDRRPNPSGRTWYWDRGAIETDGNGKEAPDEIEALIAEPAIFTRCRRWPRRMLRLGPCPCLSAVEKRRRLQVLVQRAVAITLRPENLEIAMIRVIARRIWRIVREAMASSTLPRRTVVQTRGRPDLVFEDRGAIETDGNGKEAPDRGPERAIWKQGGCRPAETDCAGP